MEYRVSIIDGENESTLTEYPSGERFGSGTGDLAVDSDKLNEALDRLKEAVNDSNNN